MKNKFVLLLICLLVVLSMNVIFAEDPAVVDEPVILDVEVSKGHLDFDAEELLHSFDVDYDTEVLTFTPIFAQSEDPANITVEINGEPVIDPVADGDDWIYDTVDVDLTIGENEIEMLVTKDPNVGIDDDETETLYTFTVTRKNVLDELNVYVDGERVDLEPEFDSNVVVYDKLLTMPDQIELDLELADLLGSKIYRVVITNAEVDTIFEDDDLDSINELSDPPFDVDYLLDEIVYGDNVITIAIETDESTDETPDWQEYESYTLTFEVSSLELITLESVDEDIDPDVLEDVTIVPDFTGDVLAYTALVGYEVDSLNISAFLIVDEDNATDEDSEIAISVVDATATTYFAVYESGNVVNYDFDDHLTADVVVTVTNGDSEIVYTVTVTKEGRLETLEFSYDDDLDSTENDWAILEMTPEFDTTDQEYVIEVPYDVAEVALDAALPTELSELDIYVDTVIYNPLDNLMAVAYGEQLVVVEIKDGIDVVEAYVVTLRRPMPLITLDVTPVGDYGFDPSDFNYSIKVENEVDEVVLTPTAALDVEIYINDVLLETTDKIVGLDEGKNTIVVMTKYDNVSMEYVLRITRDGDEDTAPPKDMNKFSYEFTEMDIHWNGDNLVFGGDSYRDIVQAFKYGNNQNNELVVLVPDKNGTLTIPYHIYKFMVQRKVTIVLEYDEVDYRIELAELKLSRYIKGPNAVENIVLEFDIDTEDRVFEVKDEFEAYESKNKSFNTEDNDDDDDDDDDNDKSNKNGKIPPGKNK